MTSTSGSSASRPVELFRRRDGAGRLVELDPLVAFLCSDVAAVTAQVFCVRKNEIFLFSPLRPIRSLHRGEGWTFDSIVDEFFPAIRPSLFPLQVSSDVFSWDPV